MRNRKNELEWRTDRLKKKDQIRPIENVVAYNI